MPSHIADMTNPELATFIRTEMEKVAKGDLSQAEETSERFKSVGIIAGMFVTPVSQRIPGQAASLTPRETMLWYAGQFVEITTNKAWFAVNSMINCLDRFVPNLASQN